MWRQPLGTLSIGLVVAAACVQACQRAAHQPAAGGTLLVYSATNTADPLKAALDTFAARNGVTVKQENASSAETAKKLTDLHQIPDLIALADERAFPTQLIPQYASWYARFGRDRMTIAFTYESKYSDQLTAQNWYQILARPGVQVGRADPSRDPNGYQTLVTLELAERYYRHPGLSEVQLRVTPDSNIRPTVADLFVMLQADALDYVWTSASLAHGDGVKTVVLPPEIDLSAIADSAQYAAARVVVRRGPHDSTVYHGQPLVFGLSVPTAAPHPDLAARAAAFVLSADGQRIMHAAHLDQLDTVRVIGSSVPPAMQAVRH